MSSSLTQRLITSIKIEVIKIQSSKMQLNSANYFYSRISAVDVLFLVALQVLSMLPLFINVT